MSLLPKNQAAARVPAGAEFVELAGGFFWPRRIEYRRLESVVRMVGRCMSAATMDPPSPRFAPVPTAPADPPARPAADKAEPSAARKKKADSARDFRLDFWRGV